MFGGQLNEVETAFEQIRSAMDEDTWRANLRALNDLSVPRAGEIVLLAALREVHSLPVAPTVLLLAYELSFQLQNLSMETRGNTALSAAIYALSIVNMREKTKNEQGKEDPAGRR